MTLRTLVASAARTSMRWFVGQRIRGPSCAAMVNVLVESCHLMASRRHAPFRYSNDLPSIGTTAPART